jgi:hypothetical protein
MTDADFSEYRRLIEDFMVETRASMKDNTEQMIQVREELVRLRTQLSIARWLVTPVIAAIVASTVALLSRLIR